MKSPSVLFRFPSSLRSETWKQIEGFPDYAVSDQGKVWSSKQEGRLLTPYTNESNTYLVVKLYRDGEKKQRLVHSLVMQHHRPGQWRDYVEGELEIHHKDNDPLNNRVENLEYVTREENEREKHRDDDLYIPEEERQNFHSADNAPF